MIIIIDLSYLCPIFIYLVSYLFAYLANYRSVYYFCPTNATQHVQILKCFLAANLDYFFCGNISSDFEHFATAHLPDSTPLQQVQIPVIGPNQCAYTYANLVNITDKMICAGEANKGACQVKLHERVKISKVAQLAFSC